MDACCQRIAGLLCQSGQSAPRRLAKLVEKTGLARSSVICTWNTSKDSPWWSKRRYSKVPLVDPRCSTNHPLSYLNKGSRLNRTKFPILQWVHMQTWLKGAVYRGGLALRWCSPVKHFGLSSRRSRVQIPPGALYACMSNPAFNNK